MKKELIAYKDPKSPVSEVFRTLRTNIQFMSSKGALKTLLVTSTLPGEGKSWVASNLAVTFAQAGKNVILIDADMRKGRQYTIFGASPIPGISNYLSGVNGNSDPNTSLELIDYIQETEIKNLYLMPAGNIPPNPSELLVSPKMVELLNNLKEICDLVIIDGTPCELVTDSLIIARLADSTIVVTASKETKKDNLKRVIANIKNVGGNLAGVVLNKIPISAKKYEQSYYYGSAKMQNKGNSGMKHNQRRNIEQMKNRIRPVENLKPTMNNNSKPNFNVARDNNIQSNHINNNSDNHKINQNNTQERVLKNKINYENSGTISLEKTNEILKQINEYIDKEKKNLK